MWGRRVTVSACLDLDQIRVTQFGRGWVNRCWDYVATLKLLFFWWLPLPCTANIVSSLPCTASLPMARLQPDLTNPTHNYPVNHFTSLIVTVTVFPAFCNSFLPLSISLSPHVARVAVTAGLSSFTSQPAEQLCTVGWPYFNKSCPSLLSRKYVII